MKGTELKTRMEEPDFLAERLVSFNEMLFSDSAVPPPIREEFRLLMRDLQKTSADRKRRIANLADINHDLMDTLNGSAVCHYFVDKDLCLRRFFSGCPQETQLRSSDVGKPLEGILRQIGSYTVSDDVRRTLTTGEVVSKEVYDGQNRWFNVIISPEIAASDGGIMGAHVRVNDVTTVKDLERKLDERNKSLMRINEDLDNFVFTTSRHLLDPLSQLAGLLELLKTKIPSDNPEVSNVIEKVEQALAQFKGHLSELDEIAAIETHMLKTASPVEIESVLKDVRLGLHDLLESSGTTIVTDFAEKEINFSKKSLRSILLNLITHSIRRRSPTRKLELYIATYAVPGYIVLMLKNNGLGVCDEAKRTLFQKTNVSLEGNPYDGLGLYLVRRIIEASNGKIEVESPPEGGAVFKVYLGYDFLI